MFATPQWAHMYLSSSCHLKVNHQIPSHYSRSLPMAAALLEKIWEQKHTTSQLSKITTLCGITAGRHDHMSSQHEVLWPEQDRTVIKINDLDEVAKLSRRVNQQRTGVNNQQLAKMKGGTKCQEKHEDLRVFAEHRSMKYDCVFACGSLLDGVNQSSSRLRADKSHLPTNNSTEQDCHDAVQNRRVC